jgi:hypothetical protein
VYIRPHVLEIENQPGPVGAFPARVLHINPAGPIVRIELSTFAGEPVRVDVVRERYDARRLTRGASVYLRPAANSVFVVPDDRKVGREPFKTPVPVAHIRHSSSPAPAGMPAAASFER